MSFSLLSSNSKVKLSILTLIWLCVGHAVGMRVRKINNIKKKKVWRSQLKLHIQMIWYRFASCPSDGCRNICAWLWHKSAYNSCSFTHWLHKFLAMWSFLCSVSFSLSLFPCSGELRTQKLVPSGENTELKRSPFKAWSRSAYSHTCYAYCQEFLPCLFLSLQSIHLHFSQNHSWFFSCVDCG